MKKILNIITIGVFATLLGMPICNECVAKNNYLTTASVASTLKGNKYVVTRDVWVQDFKKIKIKTSCISARGFLLFKIIQP